MFFTDAVVVVTVARMLSGRRLGRGRVLWTCLAAATAFTVYAAIGIYGITGKRSEAPTGVSAGQRLEPRTR